MIAIEEITPDEIEAFWDLHIRYLVDDGIIEEAEDISYFKGQEYRGILEEHMRRKNDRHHIVYFTWMGNRMYVPERGRPVLYHGFLGVYAIPQPRLRPSVLCGAGSIYKSAGSSVL